MNKVKFLHRKGGNVKKWKVKKNYTKISFYGGELPFHESMRKFHSRGNCFYNHGYIDFTPVSKLFKERINQDWNDIYSEIIKKTSPKFRWLLEDFLRWQIQIPIFIEHTPYHKRWTRNCDILLHNYFIDENNLLRYYETEEDLLKDVRILIRIDKLEKLAKLSQQSH